MVREKKEKSTKRKEKDLYHHFSSDGQGRQTYVNNDVYNGSWKEGKMHGEVSAIIFSRYKCLHTLDVRLVYIINAIDCKIVG